MLTGADRLRGVVGESATRGNAPGERQVLPLVMSQRLVHPVERAERHAKHEPGYDRDEDPLTGGTFGQAHPRGLAPPSKRSAEICSETRPTRNTTTENMISRTDPFGMRECTATFQMP